MKERAIRLSDADIMKAVYGQLGSVELPISRQPDDGCHYVMNHDKSCAIAMRGSDVAVYRPTEDDDWPECPYQIGMTLWVQEAYSTMAMGQKGSVVYRATDYNNAPASSWRSGSQMKRENSRIFLRVQDVDVKLNAGGRWVWLVTVEKNELTTVY